MARTDWTLDQTVMPEDMNQIGQEINQNRDDLTAHVADYVRQPGYAVATGSANTYAVTLNPAPTAYVDGMAVAVKINVDNTGASTLNVNGLGAKPIKKPNGNDVAAGNLKAGSVYTLRYNGTNFILQGEGGSGDAQPGDVLSGKTFTNDAGEQVGTMPNRGNVSQTLTNQGQEYTIPAGYHAGGGKVTANITNLSAPNIKYGATVGGVAGTFSQTANGASAGQILSGREAFVNGAQVIGTMPNRTGHVTGQSISRSGTTLRIRPQPGYYPGDSGNSVAWDDPNWVAENIRQGVSIFGLTGTLVEGIQPVHLTSNGGGHNGTNWVTHAKFTMSVSANVICSGYIYELNNNGTAYCRIHKNGVQIGPTFSTRWDSSQGRKLISVVTTVAPGDVIEFITYGEYSSSYAKVDTVTITNYVEPGTGGTTNI